MQINLNIFTISNHISIIVGLFLAIHFLTLKGSREKTNQYLGLFLLLTSFSVIGNEFENNQTIIQIIATITSPFIFAPILLNYTFTLTNNYVEKIKKYKWLFLFPIFDILLSVLLNFNEIQDISPFKNLPIIISVFSIVFSLFVYVVALNEIKQHNNNIRNLFSNIENKRLNWLKLLLFVNIGFLVIWFIDDTLMLFIGENALSEILAFVSHFATLITILWIGFSALRQEIIFVPNKNIEKKEISIEPNNNLIQKFEEIKKSIQLNKLFTKQNLSLLDLSHEVGVKPKELTQLINECSGTNFYHFVNQFRVEEFKRLLLTPKAQQMSLLGLSAEAGFNSKSTFYDSFKTIEKMTPKQYQNQLKKSE